MKHWKILGAVAMATALGVLAFAVSASATTLTGPSGEGTPTIHAVNENSHINMHNAIANIECNMTIEGKVEVHGTGVTAAVPLTIFSITNCTNDWIYHVHAKGSLEIHYKEAGNGHGVGVVTWSGATISSTRFGLSCHFRTENTPVGTLTGGNPATLKLEAIIPRHGGSFLCGGSSAAWTGSFETTGTVKVDA